MNLFAPKETYLVKWKITSQWETTSHCGYAEGWDLVAARTPEQAWRKTQNKFPTSLSLVEIKKVDPCKDISTR
jgi:hypothetical protein